MGMMNLKGMMKQKTMQPSNLTDDDSEFAMKPGLLKKKPFGGMPKSPSPMKGGLAAKLTGKY